MPSAGFFDCTHFAERAICIAITAGDGHLNVTLPLIDILECSGMLKMTAAHMFAVI